MRALPPSPETDTTATHQPHHSHISHGGSAECSSCTAGGPSLLPSHCLPAHKVPTSWRRVAEGDPYGSREPSLLVLQKLLLDVEDLLTSSQHCPQSLVQESLHGKGREGEGRGGRS
ncbi:hypothetical protein CIB84_016002 [Bambusicola thoracicus]|uniref:Uncharacterized protein n=1 Tax=Bambusicola thoracicus TaxID=9083 RepID=A0A2P4S820_BAMTH|nr:hypothetical protein CIB84_016002 [Bambusicola thoracicus]